MTNRLFGRRLREQRKAKGLTIDQLAEMIGISTNYLGDVERGHKLPSMKTTIRIINALDISADILLRDDVQKAGYIAEQEISQMLSGLTPRQRKAAVEIMGTIVKNISELSEEL